MARIRYNRASDDEIMKGIIRQARRKKVDVKCPNCGRNNRINAGDILEGGKEVSCVGCELTFRLTGSKK